MSLAKLVRRTSRRVVLLAALAASCGKAPVQQGPVVPTAPTITGPFANVAGTWTGTFESANAATRTITLTAVQTTNCVDGAWVSTTGDWSGAISGFALADSYAGQISLERTADNGGKCTAVADISGPVGDTTLRWTSTGFTAVGACTGDIPQTVVVTLHR